MTDVFRQELQERLGDSYLLERELFGGGMSRVFVAREKALDRQVVVKVLPPHLAAGMNAERFRREIQVAAQLNHPHIVPLLSAGDQPGFLYYTMPFIEGESLRTILERRGRLSPREVQRILADVADALAYAHDRGVVHRDIKPGNILTLGSHALVTDFGVAKALRAALPTASSSTSSGFAIGTPAYMAPEQLAGDPAADHRMDIYALGLLAYELLAGDSPFQGSSPQATMAAQLTTVPERLDRTFPDVPGPLAALVTHCLQKDPVDRPQTARDLLRELDRMATSGYTTSTRTSASRGTRLLWVGGGIAAAIALVGAGMALGRETGNREPLSPRVVTFPATPADSAVASEAELPSRRTDTVVVRDTAPPPTLTEEDSLRIAAAVEARNRSLGIEEVSPDELDSALTLLRGQISDSMRAEVERAVRIAERLSGLSGSRRPDARGFRPPPTPAGPMPRLETIARAIRDSLVVRIGQHADVRTADSAGSLRRLMLIARQQRATAAVIGAIRSEGSEIMVTLNVLQPGGQATVIREHAPASEPFLLIERLLQKLGVPGGWSSP
jgi:serine/threonine-protein kinase